jgi:hypothetical protein
VREVASATPTATRFLPPQDTLTITMAQVDGRSHLTAQLVSPDGTVQWTGVGRASEDQAVDRFVVPLAGVSLGPCEFVVSAGSPTGPRMTFGVLGASGMP